MRNCQPGLGRLTEVFEVHFGWAVEGVGFHRGGAAVIAGGDALKNQFYNILRLFRAFQSPVDGVGQTEGIGGREIAFLEGLVVFRRLL